MQLRVTARTGTPSGILTVGGRSVDCALGPAGLVADKREGDGGTPLGEMALKCVYFRPDRLDRPQTRLETDMIRPDMCWCDDPDSPAYNKLVSRPFSGSCEEMWRDDHVYDICVVLDWNLKDPQPGKGSAIFFHLAREGYQPTEGCIAVSLEDMLLILKDCMPGSALVTEIAGE